MRWSNQRNDRVSKKSSFITVDAYRNEAEKKECLNGIWLQKL